MPITPLDVRKKSFPTQLRGFSTREVKSFLELVAKEMEELRKERGLLAEKVDELAAKLEGYERTEQLLKETLLTAQKTTGELRTTAEAQAEVLLAKAEQEAKGELLQARKEAGEIIQQAKRQEEELTAKLKEIETRRATMVDQVRGIAHSCLSMAERWEKESEKNNK